MPPRAVTTLPLTCGMSQRGGTDPGVEADGVEVQDAVIKPLAKSPLAVVPTTYTCGPESPGWNPPTGAILPLPGLMLASGGKGSVGSGPVPAVELTAQLVAMMPPSPVDPIGPAN